MAAHENLAGGLIGAAGALIAAWIAWTAVQEQINSERERAAADRVEVERILSEDLTEYAEGMAAAWRLLVALPEDADQDRTSVATMDGYQFIASIIGSLAWPALVLIVFLVLRGRIAGLLNFLKEAELPWGVKLTFDRALANATAQAEQIAPEVQQAEADTLPERGYVAFATDHPEAAIMESFREIEMTLWEMVRFLALPTKGRDNDSVLRELGRLGYIDDKTIKLFESLRDARNAAVHAGKSGRLSPAEALRYHDATRVLYARLRNVLEKLKIDNPQKREWG
jgi:hypothetical protein